MIASRMLLSCSILVGVHSQGLAKAHLSELPQFDDDSFIPLDESQLTPMNFGPGEYNDLLPYVLPSPNQEDAGSCLYMAITGIAELWQAKLNPELSRAPNGPIDFSERYIMNYAGIEEDETQLENWRTDSIYLFNQTGQSVLNKAYPYRKGFYTGTASSGLEIAEENTPEAEYGTTYNWISELDSITWGQYKMPKFIRQVIFADPEQNQWNIGVTPDGIVETVKEALRKNAAPILVIYNQNAYWHAVYLVGYSDHISNNHCAYTESFRTKIKRRAQWLEEQKEAATTDEDRAYYEIRAQRAWEASEKIETAYREGGGCTSDQGVFYIRDSIYTGGEDEPMYDYDPSRTGDERRYSKRIVVKSYDWLRYFSNHISQVFVAQ